MTISVIMPVYNAGKYLEEAIQSILNQTYKDFEFIIINDGSTDESLKVIEKYKNLDDRIVLINRENRGLIASLNEGIEKAHGEYIARMDADDISLNTRFEKQIKLMEYKQLDICGCHYARLNEYGKYIDTIYTPLDDNSLVLYLILAVPFAHGSAMIRKDFINKYKIQYGLNNIKYAEDKAFWIDMFRKNAKFGNVNEILFEYRELSGSISKIKAKEYQTFANDIKLSFIKEFDKDLRLKLLKISMDISNLSNLEMEHLADLSLLLFFLKKDVVYWRIFKKLAPRYKIISFFKFLANFFS